MKLSSTFALLAAGALLAVAFDLDATQIVAILNAISVWLAVNE